MQVAVAAAFRPPDPAEVGDHVAHRGLGAMTGEAGAEEADHLPVLGGQGQVFLGGQDPGEVLGPFRRIDQVTLAVGEQPVLAHHHVAGGHARVGVASRRQARGEATAVLVGLGDGPELDGDLPLQAPIETLPPGYQDPAAGGGQVEARHPRPVGQHRRGFQVILIQFQDHRGALEGLVGGLHRYFDGDHLSSPVW